ncbi:hypothetical protein QR680_019035 [Steinernema hermaphroditum]|uniref:Uncharacterized protein n=1 Tax=Steinernema hermaphroditum TaxID=289476 RepID=A0AA39HJS3_9BILA|nr:hypothetical protein QR680_019035 [Steinernema hermaphroditum]
MFRAVNARVQGQELDEYIQQELEPWSERCDQLLRNAQDRIVDIIRGNDLPQYMFKLLELTFLVNTLRMQETDIEPRSRRALAALSVTAASGGPIAVAGSVVSSLITWGILKDNDVLQAIERICAGKEELCLRKLNLPDRSKRHLRCREATYNLFVF